MALLSLEFQGKFLKYSSKSFILGIFLLLLYFHIHLKTDCSTQAIYISHLKVEILHMQWILFYITCLLFVTDIWIFLDKWKRICELKCFFLSISYKCILICIIFGFDIFVYQISHLICSILSNLKILLVAFL